MENRIKSFQISIVIASHTTCNNFPTNMVHTADGLDLKILKLHFA